MQSIYSLRRTCRKLNSVYNELINGKLCLCLDSTKVHLIEGPKSKFSGGAYPRNPVVWHMLFTQIHTCPSPPSPPNYPYNLILLPFGQKAERNPEKQHFKLVISNDASLSGNSFLIVVLHRLTSSKSRRSLLPVTVDV